MKNNMNYKSYSVTGKGKFYTTSQLKKHPFNILNISALGARLSTETKLEINSSITMELRLEGHLSNILKTIKGTVIGNSASGIKNYYDVKFSGLSDIDIIELDEFLRINYSFAVLHSRPIESGGSFHRGLHLVNITGM